MNIELKKTFLKNLGRFSILPFLVMFLLLLSPLANSDAYAAAPATSGSSSSSSASTDTVTRVMCNIINFTKKLGMPIITGVILGSSIMAIFGKFGWGAIVMLVVFTAVFFGSEQIISIFVKGVGGGAGGNFSCASYI